MLYTLDTLPAEIELGDLLTVCAVSAASVVKDVRENLRNLVGGELKHYEALTERTLERALRKLEAKASERGYDGVLGIKIATPKVVEGGVEIVVYGNGFRYKDQAL